MLLHNTNRIEAYMYNVHYKPFKKLHKLPDRYFCTLTVFKFNIVYITYTSHVLWCQGLSALPVLISSFLAVNHSGFMPLAYITLSAAFIALFRDIGTKK